MSILFSESVRNSYLCIHRSKISERLRWESPLVYYSYYNMNVQTYLGKWSLISWNSAKSRWCLFFRCAKISRKWQNSGMIRRFFILLFFGATLWKSNSEKIKHGQMLGRNFFRKRALRFEILLFSNMMIKRKCSSRVKLSRLLVSVEEENDRNCTTWFETDM